MLTLNILTSDETCAMLGDRVRQMRLQLNLTQSEVAARAGISFGSVRKLESSGLTTLATFIKCAHALGVREDFHALLTPKPSSIAEWERLTRIQTRQRARTPRYPLPPSRENKNR